MSERVFITGSGAVCGAGLSVPEIWSAIREGRSAVREITGWDTKGWPIRYAAEVVGVDNRTLVEDRKLHKLVTRTDLFGLYAGGAAIRASGVTDYRDTLPEEAAIELNDRSGVFAGSGGGSYRNNYDFFPALDESGGELARFGAEVGNCVNPMWLLRVLPNNVVCHLGIRHGFKGTNACVTNHCAGGLAAIAEATEALRCGEADRAVAVGHDAPVEPETLLYYQRVGLLATGGVVRPFSASREGTLLGEGAAAVMLETASAAAARGATVLGEVLGFGCTTEATGLLDIRADGDGLARAIRAALSDAGLGPSEVGMVVAHGNGTPASDASEARALQAIFGGDIPPVTGFKWATGHLLAASGALDVTLAVEALRDGLAPGIPTFDQPDPEIPRMPVSREPQTPRSDVALVLCRGFGGMNAALLVCGAR